MGSLEEQRNKNMEEKHKAFISTETTMTGFIQSLSNLSTNEDHDRIECTNCAKLETNDMSH